MFVTWRVWNKYHSPLDSEGGGDTGGGEPAAAEPAPAEEPADDSTESDVNWGSMADELVADDSAVEGDEVVVEEPAEPAPAPATPATPAPAEPVSAAPAPSPAPAGSEEKPLPVAPPAPTASNEEYSTWRAARLTQLEQVYALDPESATAMLTEPELVLPKLAAKVHMEVMENSMRAMQAMVPVMLQQVQYHTEIEGRAKNLFTSINPDLADPRYEPAILQLGQVYRNVNKTASPEVAAQAIGNLVRAALGIAAPVATGVQPQAAVAQPAVTPFTPARGAGGGSVPVRSGNQFELLAQEMENEDW